MTEKIIYQFNGETYETREEAEEAVHCYAEETFDDVIDMEEDVVVCGLSYSPSIVLKRVDEVAYRCYLHDYADSLMYDIEEIEADEENEDEEDEKDAD